MSSKSEVITIKPVELVPGRHASRARIVVTGLGDDDIDGRSSRRKGKSSRRLDEYCG